MTHTRNIGQQLFGSPKCWCMHKVKKSQNQDLRANPGWRINSRKIESSPCHFLDFRCLRAAASSSRLKGPAILHPAGVWTFHMSGSSFLEVLVDPRLPVLCAPFFTSCETMEFAETWYRREERPGMPIGSFLVLNVLRLECESSMEQTAYSHHSCLFCSSRESRVEAVLSESVHTGVRRKAR